MAELSDTYDQEGVPACTATKTTSDVTGASTFSVVIDLLELDPGRSITSEERTKGITSLNPPTVEARTANDLVRLSVEACCNAYDETEGYSLDAESLTYMSMKISQTVLQALRKIGEDV